jgi:ribonuclease HII
MRLGPGEPARGTGPEAPSEGEEGAPGSLDARVPSRRRPLIHKGETLCCSWRYEEEAWTAGCGIVVGIDEVGRGALCGPVVAGAVILDRSFPTDGIDDSKRLTRRQRERLAVRIRKEARAWALGQCEAWEIDRINILRATHQAMQRALEALGVNPELALVDGTAVQGLGVTQRAIVKGDALSFSIAAASIVAKVARDGIMRDWDVRCPGYGLAENMGYGSREHLDALARLGPSEIHRRSFAGTQPWLDFGEA